MRRSFIVLAVALTATAMLLGGTPVRAGELSWTDAEADAFPAGPATNAALDIQKVSLKTTADEFIWTTQVAAVGEPRPTGTGHHYTLEFTFGEASFLMRVTQDLVAGNGIVFEKSDETTPTVQNLGCAKCKLDINPDTNTITLRATLGTMQAASRKLVPGAKIEGVTVYTSVLAAIPEVGTLYFGSGQGDSAPPPDPASFTF